MKYGYGDTTQVVDDQIFELGIYDEDIDIDRIFQFMNEICKKNLFYEGIVNELKNKNNDVDSNNPKGVLGVVQELLKKKKIEITSISKWITKNVIPSERSREAVYRLCFAFDMNEIETEEFFLKSYLFMPYNFKNAEEIIYYYCLKKRYSYSKALEMISRCKNLPVKDNSLNQCTIEIKNRVYNIDDDEEIVLYAGAIYNSEMKSFETAINQFKYYLDENVSLINKEKEITYGDADIDEDKDYDDEKGEKAYNTSNQITKVNRKMGVFYSRVLSNILFYDEYNNKYKINKEEKEKKKEDISNKDILNKLINSNYGKYLRESLLGRQQMSNILNDDSKITSTMIKKALMIMYFYNFYMSIIVAEVEKDPDYQIDLYSFYEDFLYGVNEVLDKCGFVQLYPRNPYDAIFLICANTHDPIYEFRKIYNEVLVSK